MRLSSWLGRLASGLFVLSLPVLFGTLSLRWLVSDVGWYKAGFAKYGVSEPTNMAPAELDRSAGEISRYLLIQRDNVDIPVKVGGVTIPLFNEREIHHMEDVQKLLSDFYNLQAGVAAYVLLYLAVGWIRHRGGGWPLLGTKLRWGGALTLGLFAGFGVLSMFNFDELFLQFHVMSFDNDLWILDPSKDRLVMMFPQGFWYDSAIRLALGTGAQALGALLIGLFIERAFSRQTSAAIGHPAGVASREADR